MTKIFKQMREKLEKAIKKVIQTEENKQAAEPDFKFPDDAESTSRPNETAEVVTRETAEETNTELLQSIDKKLDMLLAAQAAKEE